MDSQEREDALGAEGALARRFAWVFGVLAVVLAVFVIWAGRDWRTALSMAKQGSKVPTEAYVKWGMWWAGLVNAFLCGLLALTSKWWAGEKLQGPGIMARGITKREWAWLVLVLVAAGGLRWARMDLSFYNDEAHTFRTYVAGRFRQSDDGQITFRSVKWLDTFWFDKVGNNLMPCSVFGRLSYDAWRKLTDAPAGAVCETAVRLPQWIAGMTALVVLWLAARRILGAQAAWIALLLMALHPWAVRYSSEARAYGMLLLGVTLCFYFLQRAFEDGRWRWWLGLGLAEFLCVWSFSGVVFFLVVFNTSILIRLVVQWRRGGDGNMVLRPLLGILIGGMLALQIMLPTLPQLIEAMNLNSLKGQMGRVWWIDVLGGLLWGTRGLDGDPVNPINLALERMLAQQPLLWGVLIMEVCLLAVGLVILVMRGGAGRILALAGPLALIAGWVMMAAQNKYLHPWYVIYVIPVTILYLSSGINWFIKLFTAKFLFSWAVILMISVLGVAWLEVDYLYTKRSKENVRGIAETVRGVLGAKGSEAGLFAAMLSDVDIYDPAVLAMNGEKDLNDLVLRARREEVPLIVSVGHVGMGATAQVMKRLEGSGEFEPVATLWGLEEPQFSHHIFRLRRNP